MHRLIVFIIISFNFPTEGLAQTSSDSSEYIEPVVFDSAGLAMYKSLGFDSADIAREAVESAKVVIWYKRYSDSLYIVDHAMDTVYLDEERIILKNNFRFYCSRTIGGTFLEITKIPDSTIVFDEPMQVYWGDCNDHTIIEGTYELIHDTLIYYTHTTDWDTQNYYDQFISSERMIKAVYVFHPDGELIKASEVESLKPRSKLWKEVQRKLKENSY